MPVSEPSRHFDPGIGIHVHWWSGPVIPGPSIGGVGGQVGPLPPVPVVLLVVAPRARRGGRARGRRLPAARARDGAAAPAGAVRRGHASAAAARGQRRRRRCCREPRPSPSPDTHGGADYGLSLPSSIGTPRAAPGGLRERLDVVCRIEDTRARWPGSACSTGCSARSSPRWTSCCAGRPSTSRTRARPSTSSPAPASSPRRLAAARGSARLAVALLLGLAVTAQIAFFRYFHAPFDDQAAVAARLAWVDVRPVVWHALPALAASTLAIAALELPLALLDYEGRTRRSPRTPSISPERREGRPLAAALAMALEWPSADRSAMAPPRFRTAQAAAALVLHPRGRAPAPGHRPELPPLASRRARVPSILFILTESVRASDWCGDPAEPCPLSPEIARLLPARSPLLQMRATASYTAISLSVLLGGMLQLGSREPIAAGAHLFDCARHQGRRTPARSHYWSAHKPNFFEREDPGGRRGLLRHRRDDARPPHRGRRGGRRRRPRPPPRRGVPAPR